MTFDDDRAAERFLIREGRLLDERRYHDWLDLLTGDFHYSLPLPMVREDPYLPRYHERAVFFEATKTGLSLKLGRVGERTAWSDRPHNFTRRFLSNVETERVDEDLLLVKSNVLVTVIPSGEEATITSAGREDLLRTSADGTFMLARRTVYLDVEVPTDVQLSFVF
ncbi:aromatic-ring-hydroxylating dioxygenase subunit beta [Microtetraspora malaysiensis]|uniref:aromatic-ring-hydroxylating dioxygenase subunit beta n=1 Tax=Microtetraspora malaysiensis TaxID=161358 RepID=UPI003D8B6F84